MSEYGASTALVSWAHRNPGWTDDQAEAWISQVVTFASLLRDSGIDADLDLWNDNDPAIDWTRWGQRKVQDSDFVVIVVSRAWKERWEGSNSPKQGAGAVAEADVLKSRFERNQEEFQRKTILALLPGADEKNIPDGLHRLNRSYIKSLDREGVEDLVRSIFLAPRHLRPPLGDRPAFSSATAKTRTAPRAAEVSAVRADLDAVNELAPQAVNLAGASVTPQEVHPHGSGHMGLKKPELTVAEELSYALDNAVLSQVFLPWSKETELFASLAKNPSRTSIESSLQKSIEDGLLSGKGPRVAIYDTYFSVRFLTSQTVPAAEVLTLQLEGEMGPVLSQIEWEPSLSVTEVLTKITEELLEQPNFDGVLGYFPSSIFTGLSEMLTLASEGRKGLGFGSRHSFRKVVEIVDGYWVVTETGIFPKNQTSYVISASRLDEMDWVEHIRGKQWEGESGIDRALAIGRKLLSS